MKLLKQKSKAYMLNLTEKQHNEIKSKAKRLGISIKTLIILAVKSVKGLKLN